LLIFLLVVAPLTAQQTPITPAAAPQAAQPAAQPTSALTQAPTAAPAVPTLEDGTPVKLRLGRTISSAEAHVGETVDFDVLEEIYVGKTLVVPKGGVAWATVTEAQSKRRMGRGGKLNMNIDSVRLADGEKVALRAVKDAKGGGHVGAMTGAIVATAIVFFPAAPLFLFMHGKDITIPKGTEITAYINGNVPLDLAKFSPQGAAPQVASAASNAGQAILEISSTPTGADIEIDGSFVGNAPSALGVAPGEHNIKLMMAGYTGWERKIKTSSGNVKIAAELQPTPADKNVTAAPQPPQKQEESLGDAARRYQQQRKQ
jgi:hypothetical protein